MGPHAGGTDPSATTKEEVVTPNIDELVSQGILLENHYSYNWCGPSRASIQTGRLPVHVTISNEEPIAVNPKDPISGFAGAPTKMTGIATKLKGAGYRTHFTGKWDVGMASVEQTPMAKGYDTFFGYYHHANDYWTEKLGLSSTGTLDPCYKEGLQIVDLWNTTGPAFGRNGTVYEEYLFLESSLGVIEAHDPSVPLFLFHSFHLVHTPLQVPKEYEEKFDFLTESSRRRYAGMVHLMDELIGKLVGAFKRKGMWDNTLVIFSADNGGPMYSAGVVEGGSNNVPLKGGKFTDWQGGIRVNAFVSGGKIPQARRGAVEHRLVHLSDWYATLCALARVNKTDIVAQAYGLPPVDGLNQWPMIAGQLEEEEEEEQEQEQEQGEQGEEKEKVAEMKTVRDEIHVSPNTLIATAKALGPLAGEENQKGLFKIVTGDATLPMMVPNNIIPSWAFPKHLMPLAGSWPGYGSNAVFNSLTKWQLCRPGCLYDLNSDPTEQNDLYKSHKALGDLMLAKLDLLNKDNFNPNRGQPAEGICDIFMSKYKGFYGPFVDAHLEDQQFRSESMGQLEQLEQQ